MTTTNHFDLRFVTFYFKISMIKELFDLLIHTSISKVQRSALSLPLLKKKKHWLVVRVQYSQALMPAASAMLGRRDNFYESQ